MDYVIWFNDGHRESLGREDLAEYSERFDFDAEEVQLSGDVDFLDEDGGVVGGIFAVWPWHKPKGGYNG